MKSREFRQWGHALIDWLADYQDRVGSLPVTQAWQANDFRRQLPEHPPKFGESFEAIYQDIDRLIVPYISHWQSPHFFGYFPANTSGPSILGELLSAGLSVQGMLWATSPACTELETHVLDWLQALCQLPEKFKSTGQGGGVLLDSSSSATLLALIAAREKFTAGETRLHGLQQDSAPLVVYVSESTHSSAIKAARIAGIGDDHIRILPTDAADRMDPHTLQKAIQADKASGARPFFCVATIGTTAINAIDPIEEISALCRQAGLWCHVDAAMAGSAAICPEKASLFKGLDGVTSYTFNPHKWLLTNPDCNALYLENRQDLIDALKITPSYLENEASKSGEVIDYRDWQISLGRRFRALKLWFVIRYYGAEGLQNFIRKHLMMAQWLKDQVAAHPDFIGVGDTPLALVCFKSRSGSHATRALVKALNATGKIFLTSAEVKGETVARLSIGVASTEPDHVRAAWELIQNVDQTLERNKDAIPT